MTHICKRHGRIHAGDYKIKEGYSYVCPYCERQQLLHMRKGKPVNEEEYQAVVYLLDGTTFCYERRSTC